MVLQAAGSGVGARGAAAGGVELGWAPWRARGWGCAGIRGALGEQNPNVDEAGGPEQDPNGAAAPLSPGGDTEAAPGVLKLHAGRLQGTAGGGPLRSLLRRRRGHPVGARPGGERRAGRALRFCAGGGARRLPGDLHRVTPPSGNVACVGGGATLLAPGPAASAELDVRSASAPEAGLAGCRACHRLHRLGGRLLLGPGIGTPAAPRGWPAQPRWARRCAVPQRLPAAIAPTMRAGSVRGWGGLRPPAAGKKSARGEDPPLCGRRMPPHRHPTGW